MCLLRLPRYRCNRSDLNDRAERRNDVKYREILILPSAISEMLLQKATPALPARITWDLMYNISRIGESLVANFS